MLRPMSLPACRMERVELRSNTPCSQNTSMLSTLRLPADICCFRRGSWTCRMSFVASATVFPLDKGHRRTIKFHIQDAMWDKITLRMVHTWALRGLHSRWRRYWWATCVWPPRSPPASWAQSAAPGRIRSYTPPGSYLPAASGPACCWGRPAAQRSSLLECAPPWSGSLHQPGARPCRWHLPAVRKTFHCTFSFSCRSRVKKEGIKVYLPSLQIHAPCHQPRLDGCGHRPTLKQEGSWDGNHW